MSKQLHTQEPWELHEARTLAHIRQVGKWIASVPYKTPSEKEYANRIVACVNACAGIPTEQLENTHDLNVLYEEVTNQRDGLLAALKAMDAAEAAYQHAAFIKDFVGMAQAESQKLQASAMSNVAIAKVEQS